VYGRLNASELRIRLLPRSGGQGVADSNPAIPTGNRAFSNMFVPHMSQQKSQSSGETEPITGRASIRVPGQGQVMEASRSGSDRSPAASAPAHRSFIVLRYIRPRRDRDTLLGPRPG